VTLPGIMMEAQKENGIVMYEDEAIFSVSGSLSRTWCECGRKNGGEVESKATRESMKAFGATSADQNPDFHFLFADVFNAQTFLNFLKRLVGRHDRKIHLILDNARYHHAILLQEWLSENSGRIQLHFLPAYSPKLNAQEGVWRLTRRKSTHNRFFNDEKQLHSILFRRFNRFQGNPASLRKMMAPFVNNQNAVMNAENDGDGNKKAA
jgi:transposase